MNNAPPGIKDKDPMTEELTGLKGTLGKGNTCVNFLQVNIPIDSIDKLGLVSEIPGSEQWPIRQLFQRDIDQERVRDEIIPYFLEGSQPKFFNPLTIAVLPISKGGVFKSDLVEKKVTPSSEYIDGDAFGIDELYKLSYSSESQVAWGQFKWNPSKVRLIAIDGQHRLSALKRIHSIYQKDSDGDDVVASGFKDWVIPIVIGTLGQYEGESSSDAIIDKTRSIFVTINKQAKPPSRSRTILLNDYSITALACQEALDNCRKDDNDLSLALFDWREYKDDDLPEASTFLLSVDELEDIHINYLLGEDDKKHFHIKLSDNQKECLFWKDMEPPVSDAADDDSIRGFFKDRYEETIFKVIVKLFTLCKPYDEYVKSLNEIEASLKHDTEQHAWSRLVYGADFAESVVEKDVIKEKNKILETCQNNKKKLGRIFSQKVGMRGMFSAFQHYVKYYNTVAPWEMIADDFTGSFNEAYEHKFFDEKWLLNLAIDRGDGIINYKSDQVKTAIGSYIAYVALSVSDISGDKYNDGINRLEDNIMKILKAGYKKSVRPEVREEHPEWQNAKVNDEVNERAEQLANKQFTKIKRKISDLNSKPVSKP